MGNLSTTNVMPLVGMAGLLGRIRLATKVALGLDVPGRNVAIRPTDVFLVSYPKSGNTWARFLLGNITSNQEGVSFRNIEDVIPDIYVNTRRKLLSMSDPRILKSHEAFDPRYPKVIYLVRDPRDVFISYYHHQIKFRKLPEGYPLDRFLDLFLNGGLDEFGTWYENVSSWTSARRGNSAFLLVKYEDLLRDPVTGLDSICEFLGLDVGGKRLEEVVELSSAQRMRSLEEREARRWAPTKNSNKSMRFVRKAKSGGWREEVPVHLMHSLESRWGEVMLSLGYQ